MFSDRSLDITEGPQLFLLGLGIGKGLVETHPLSGVLQPSVERRNQQFGLRVVVALQVMLFKRIRIGARPGTPAIIDG